MASLHRDNQFKLRALSSALLACSVSLAASSAFALQEITDEDLGESTGGAIAFLPENFSLLFQGANATNPTAADLADRTKDTGYIRYIPVGPLTPEAAAIANTGKGDLFLYGLAISQSNDNYGVGRDSSDWNGRFGRVIDSWGTAANPWVFKVKTQSGVPDFSALTPTDSGNGSVTYLALEAPRYDVNVAALSAAEKSAYNLKMAYWADAFVRDPKYADAMGAAALTSNQFCLGGSSGCATAANPRANRLRLQAIWDGFSLNGSQLQVFQTLGGATSAGGMSTFYNNTLGIAGVLRFNSGDTQNFRATVSNNLVSSTSTSVVYDGAVYNSGGTNCTVASSGTYQNDQCNTREQVTTTKYSAAGGGASTASWTPPVLNSVLRYSTQECGAGNLNGCTTPTAQGLLNSPAVNGGNAPTFDSKEGLYLYSPNINLVLGSLYQPLTVGVAPDGKNISLEIARIPNKESIYKQVYINYDNINPATNGGYTGSTCNIYECGNNGSGTYQGTNATHSSITIGSTIYNSGNKTISAYSGIEALGVSFGALTTNSITNPATSYTTLIQRSTRPNGTRSGNIFTGYTYAFGSPWSAYSGDFANTTYASPVYTKVTPPSVSSVIDTQNLQTIPSNNLGSAVIDGLLIQHMKITTKGL